MSILSGIITNSRRRSGGLPSGYSLLLDAADTNSYPGSGTSWFDLSGNNNTATLQTGMTWNAAGYMELNGTSSTGGYASIVHASNLTPTTGFSVLIWCYPTNLDGTNPRWFLSKRTSTGSDYSYVTLAFTNNAIFSDTGQGNRYNSNASLATNNAWQHFAICWSGADQAIKFYKNGVLDKLVSGTPSSITSQTANVLIGAAGGSTLRFGGRMGHITYYNNRSLLTTEVEQAYTAHRSRYGL